MNLNKFARKVFFIHTNALSVDQFCTHPAPSNPNFLYLVGIVRGVIFRLITRHLQCGIINSAAYEEADDLENKGKYEEGYKRLAAGIEVLIIAGIKTPEEFAAKVIEELDK